MFSQTVFWKGFKVYDLTSREYTLTFREKGESFYRETKFSE